MFPSARIFSSWASVKRATFIGSNCLNASRYPWRRRRIVYQLSPACAPFEDQHFKEFLIIVDRDAPLAVVVVGVVGLVGRHPTATLFFRGHFVASPLFAGTAQRKYQHIPNVQATNRQAHILSRCHQARGVPASA